MLKNFLKTFTLFSMIVLFMSSIIESTVYAAEQNSSTSLLTSNTTASDSSKDPKTAVASNDSSNKNSSSSSSTTNNKDDKSKDTTISEEKKEEIIDYGWKTINNKKFYIVNNKILETTGWFMEKDVNPNIKTKDKNYDYKYYLDKDFSVTIGWKEIDHTWYYFNPEGVMQSGWVNNNGWYYLDDSGEMKTGWDKIGTDTFYFNQYGQATIGKKLIDSKWYFFDERGRLQKGFYEHNKKTYYSDESGVMVTNQWITKGSHKFYIKADSSIAIGDLFIDGLMEKFDNNGYLDGYDKTAKNDMFVKFLNVGNADCEFIKLPSGETVLIDTGDTTTTKTLIDFLNGQNLKTEFFTTNSNGQTSDNNILKTDTEVNVTTSSSVRVNTTGKGVIDYVVLTHPHSDHIGGVIELLKNYNVGKFIVPKYFEMKDYSSGATSITQEKIDIIKYDYKVYKDTMDVLLKSGVPIVQAESDSFIDSEHILQFLHLDKDYSKLESDTYYSEYGAFNDDSAIVYLNYHDFQCLFSADIQWKAENDFFTRKALKGNEVDILKVPHHGNVGSSSYTFVGYVNPTVGVISRTKDRISTTNEPYNVLTTCGVNIYETSLTDGVSVYVTKDNWNIETK
jgi:beta-lactamase superfamily II metal-dependent hydrolase/glucan-binding YG repeat protein